jgi:hypothetical protein
MPRVIGFATGHQSAGFRGIANSVPKIAWRLATSETTSAVAKQVGLSSAYISQTRCAAQSTVGVSGQGSIRWADRRCLTGER